MSDEKILSKKGRVCPPAVRMAIAVLLNHVEPGWDNFVTLVRAWLEMDLDALEADDE